MFRARLGLSEPCSARWYVWLCVDMSLKIPVRVPNLGKSDNFTKCQKKSPPRKHSGIIARTHRSMAFEALGLLVPAARSRRCSFCRRCFTASGSARGVRALHQDASCVGEAISAQEVSATGSRVRATPPRVPGSSDLHVPQYQHDSAHSVQQPRRRTGARVGAQWTLDSDACMWLS